MAAGLTFRLFGEDVSASDALEEVGASGKKVAAGIATAFGAMALGDVITNSLDREKVFARFNAGWDASPKLAKKAADLAGRLYSQGIDASMEDVVNAIDGVGVQMVDLGTTGSKELEKITLGAMDIAYAMRVDVVEVVRAAGQMMKNGMAPDAQAALDILALGVTSGANASGDLLETFTEYGPTFLRLGIDGEAALGMIRAGLEGGIFDSDRAAVAFEDMLDKVTAGGEPVSEAFDIMGMSADLAAAQMAKGGPTAREATTQIMHALAGLTDPQAQQTAGAALFGETWITSGAQAVLAMNPARTETGHLENATKKMGDTLRDTATYKVDHIKKSFENWVTSMVETDGWMGIVAATAVGIGPQMITTGGSIAMIALATKGLWVGMAGVLATVGLMMAPLIAVAAALGAIIALVKTAADNIGRMQGQLAAARSGDYVTASSLRSPAATFGVGSWLSPVNSVVSSGIGRVTGGGRPALKMATGGVVMPTRGGTDFTAGEAGEPEAVVPLSKWSQMTGGSGGDTFHLHMPQGLIVGTADEIVQKLADLVATARRRGTLADGAFA